MSDAAKPKSALGKFAVSLRAMRERHEERHRPSGFGFAFADRVDFLDCQRWDEVTARPKTSEWRKVAAGAG